MAAHVRACTRLHTAVAVFGWCAAVRALTPQSSTRTHHISDRRRGRRKRRSAATGLRSPAAGREALLGGHGFASVRLLGLRPGDQNSLGGADADPAGVSDHDADQPQRSAQEVGAHRGGHPAGGPGGRRGGGPLRRRRGGHRPGEPRTQGRDGTRLLRGAPCRGRHFPADRRGPGPRAPLALGDGVRRPRRHGEGRPPAAVVRHQSPGAGRPHRHQADRGVAQQGPGDSGPSGTRKHLPGVCADLQPVWQRDGRFRPPHRRQTERLERREEKSPYGRGSGRAGEMHHDAPDGLQEFWCSQTCLRHPDCESARINKDAVFQRMRCALEQVVDIVTEAHGCTGNILPASIYNAVKDYKTSVECLRDDLYASLPDSVGRQLEALAERTEDFTDSPYTGHEQRQAILGMCQLARQDARQLLHAWTQAQSVQAKETTEELEVAIAKSCQSVNELTRELHKAAAGRASELLRVHAEHSPLRALKAAGAEGDPEAVAQYSRTLTEQKDQLVENCRLLCHVSGNEPLEITCVHAEETFHVIGPQIISAAQTLALHPSSKIAKENLEVFCEAWESQLVDVALLLREINDVVEGKRGDKRAYLSLPRSGKHSANLKSAKPVKLDAEEQSGVAKAGLELRLLSSDVDAELEKWEEQEQRAVRHGQSVASMAYNMYLFTRGEGLLKTTLDLFRQAEVLSEEGLQLCSSLHVLCTQLLSEEKLALTSEVEALAALCQQLQAGARTPVQGKSATFQKVDSSIQTTRAVLTLILKLLPACNKRNTKSKSERSGLGSPQDWRPDAPTPVRDGDADAHRDDFAVEPFEQHLSGLSLLEGN
ncbi:alpha-catulin isoform X2 [Phycodurus eques]|uniref:alpha-catulin isoform X2 n=1 Tax=Phycodurus eques TaxID=693459 RepID=UPI002ACE8EBD|nr:alpha-catulin isoform X2 [Phycodurus eques]